MCSRLVTEAVVAGNPKECRTYVLRCAELAMPREDAGTYESLIELSRNWMKLATELERTHALLARRNCRRPFHQAGIV